MKKTNLIGICLLLGTGITSHAAQIYSQWTGGDSGTYAWGTANNWTPSVWNSTAFVPGAAGSQPYPNNVGGNTFAAQIIHGSGDLLIETPGASATTVNRFWLEQQNAVGSTTLKLGNNFTISGVALSDTSKLTGFQNSTADAAKLVIDLNGFQFTGNGQGMNALTATNFTIKSSNASQGGIFAVQNIGVPTTLGKVMVSDNVTVKITTDSSVNLYVPTSVNGASAGDGWNFSENSTLWLTGGGTPSTTIRALYLGGNGRLGNLIIGDPATAAAANAPRYQIANPGYSQNVNVRIAGDVTYHLQDNGLGSYLILANNSTAYVGGNFTDKSIENTDYVTSTSYNGASIVFNGGTNRLQKVWISRTGLTTNFQVGETSGTAGNVKLMANLTTKLNPTNATSQANSGKFSLLGNSRIDLDLYTLTAEKVTIEEGATIGYTIGDGSNALIHATGGAAASLTLNGFRLEISYTGSGWVNGQNLLLVQYDASSFTGVANLLGIDAPQGFVYDGLAWGDVDGKNYVYLTNVAFIPEPTTGTLLVVAGGLLVFGWRKAAGGRVRNCLNAS